MDENRSHNHCCQSEHGHCCDHGKSNVINAFVAPAISLFLLVVGMTAGHFHSDFFSAEWVAPVWYVIAFLPVGLPVVRECAEALAHGNIFNEFMLMTVACIGAFLIGEYPEAVGVMLFYSVGETLQHRAVDSATKNISSLLDKRPEIAFVVREGKVVSVSPTDVKPGETIEIRPGQRVPLDGTMVKETGLFDTSALTGESIPREIEPGEEVLAGMISLRQTSRIRVTRPYGESALARILDMVRNASSRKAHAELFIRKFARIYTPAVMLLAVLIASVPAVISIFNPSFHYAISEWIYRSLVFLVISCPCALVISIPLGYFAGIGAASRLGILFKGGNYLEAITRVNTVAFDKTGTLTTGQFHVSRIMAERIPDNDMLSLMAAVESKSTHPLAKTLAAYVKKSGITIPDVKEMREYSGLGATGYVTGKKILTGSLKFLRQNNVECPDSAGENTETVIACAVDGKYTGYVTLTDTIREDASDGVAALRHLGIRKVIMLSGDRQEIADAYGKRIGIDESFGDLLPQQKAEFVERLTQNKHNSVAFAGDGMNDAPVLAVSNVGIAMGASGSDAAIESADVIIRTDSPSRIATAIKIGRYTRTVILENIIGAITVKIAIMILGALGLASLWAAVFADVGVALLAILNSLRILYRKY